MQLTRFIQSLSAGAPFLPKDEQIWIETNNGLFQCKLTGQSLGRDMRGVQVGYYGIGIEGDGTLFSSSLPRTTWAWDEFDFFELKSTQWAGQNEVNSNHFEIWSTAANSIQLIEFIYANAMWQSSVAAKIAEIPVPRFNRPLDFNLVSRLGFPS